MEKGGGGVGVGLVAFGNIEEAKMQSAERIAREQSLMGVLNEASKLGIAINGGAAVAMGALLQSLINTGGAASVRHALLWGILVTAVGVLLGTLIFVCRYLSLITPRDRGIFDNRWGRIAFGLGIASLAAFVLGLAIPLFAGFVKL